MKIRTKIEITHIEDDKDWIELVEGTLKRIKEPYRYSSHKPSELFTNISFLFSPRIMILDLSFSSTDETKSRLEITNLMEELADRYFEIYILSGYVNDAIKNEYTAEGVPQNHIINKRDFEQGVFSDLIRNSIQKIQALEIQGPFSLVHLSDLHFGSNKTNREEKKNIQTELSSDILELQKNFGTPDLIVVSGDIAYHGISNEYDEAKEWINTIRKGKKKAPKVLVIPGNHDANLNRKDRRTQNIYKVLRPNMTPVSVKKIQGEIAEDKHITELLIQKFGDFYNFCRQNDLLFSDNPITNLVYKLPKFNYPQLEIIGLNSALLSNLKDEEHRLIINPAQYILQNNGRIKIVILHHPFNWFINDRDVEEHLLSRGKIFLFGHEHQPKLSQEEIIPNLQIFSGALQPTEDELKQYRYNWITIYSIIKRSSQELVVLIAPRIWEKGRGKFQPDYNFINSCSMKPKEYIERRIKLN